MNPVETGQFLDLAAARGMRLPDVPQQQLVAVWADGLAAHPFPAVVDAAKRVGRRTPFLTLDQLLAEIDSPSAAVLSADEKRVRHLLAFPMPDAPRCDVCDLVYGKHATHCRYFRPGQPYVGLPDGLDVVANHTTIRALTGA